MRSCWLSNFNKEYINADFSHSGPRIHIVKKHTKKLINGKKKDYDLYKKDSEDRNNARNRDAYTVTKANRFLHGEDKAIHRIEENRSTNSSDIEDALIATIDIRRRRRT